MPQFNRRELDAFHYNYVNAAGNKDIIKIEINYSLRSHVLPARRQSIRNGCFRRADKSQNDCGYSIAYESDR